MVLKSVSKIYLMGNRYMSIYLPKEMITDSNFKFTKDDVIIIEVINDDTIMIKKKKGGEKV